MNKELKMDGHETVELSKLINVPLTGYMRETRDWLMQQLMPFLADIKTKTVNTAEAAIASVETTMKTVPPDMRMRRSQEKASKDTAVMLAEYNTAVDIDDYHSDIVSLLEHIEMNHGFSYDDSILFNKLMEKLK